MSLIASSCGTSGKRINGDNFQPEFDEYFTVDANEPYKNYSMHIDFVTNLEENKKFEFSKRISFRDDTAQGRGIRPLPRGAQPFGKKYSTITEATKKTKEVMGISGAARVQIPTIYISVSRLMPSGETDLEIHHLASNNKIIKKKLNEKYKELYNEVLPHSFNETEKSTETVEKSSTKKKRLFIPFKDASANTQSVGQDSLGSIISALIDFYNLSLSANYHGGILCIDEIETSLHPNAQKNLFLLLDKMAEELSLQIFLTSHSLTILKEIIKLQTKDCVNYKLIYFKGTKTPLISNFNNYMALKADLFQEQTFSEPAINIYCEDDETQKLFNLLIRAVADNKIESKLPKYKVIPIELGNENLKKLPKLDSNFRKCLIVLDADSMLKNRIKIEDYFKDTNIVKGKTLSTSKYDNIISLPGLFSPEEYLYLKIWEYVHHDNDHLSFWRQLDSNPDTTLLTSDKIRDGFVSKGKSIKFKDIHDNAIAHELFEFADRTSILSDYYKNNIELLKKWITNVEKQMNKLKQIIESVGY